jgi:hypothetical protein
MIAALASTDALSVIGFFLTLVSLLGMFFYIHLSDWLRNVIALKTKWRFHEGFDLNKQYNAILQCRYEIEQVANWTTLLTSIVVSAFVVFIFYLGAQLWLAQPEKDVAWTYVGWAGVGFFVIYIVMTVYLLLRGYWTARTLLKRAKEKFKEQPRYREHSWQFWRPKKPTTQLS